MVGMQQSFTFSMKQQMDTMQQKKHKRCHFTYILSLRLVQNVSFLPIGSLVSLTNVEFHFGSIFILLGFPFIQSHLLSTFFFSLLNLILPVKTSTLKLS